MEKAIAADVVYRSQAYAVGRGGGERGLHASRQALRSNWLAARAVHRRRLTSRGRRVSRATAAGEHEEGDRGRPAWSVHRVRGCCEAN